jgi:hypothetical protein
MYAVELWATCPRVIGQKTPSSKVSIRSQPLGEQDGNRRFRLLNGPVDRPVGLSRGPVARLLRQPRSGQPDDRTYTAPMAPADPEAAALNVACPICGVQPGRNDARTSWGLRIQSVEQPHLYRIHLVVHKRVESR